MADTARRAELQQGVDNHETAARKARMAWKAVRSTWQGIEKEHGGDPSAEVIEAHQAEEKTAERAYRDAKGDRKRAERALAEFDAAEAAKDAAPGEPSPAPAPAPAPATKAPSNADTRVLDKKWAVYIAGERAATDKAWADEIAGPRPAGWTG